jgi:glucose-6-phosphate dehydrogenase assembly protein OpcA
MPGTAATVSIGMPVELGRIDRELKQLWESSAGASTRASMMNFAVYCEGERRLAENTEIIARFMQDHACRALLIVAEPGAPEQRVQAWISAHCHVSRAGAKQVCCEQITFLIGGRSQRLIPNIVFSHLDSDLPLYLWWRAEFPEPIDEQLWTWVDRLIFDSQKWDDPLLEFRRLRASFKTIKPRMTLCDLNWTRSLYVRQAIAQTFDHPENLSYVRKFERASITYGSGHRSTAMLLTGWCMARLRWKLERNEADTVTFTTPPGSVSERVEFVFREAPGESIGECVFEGAGAKFQIENAAGSEFLHAHIHMPDGREYHHLLRSGRDETVSLLNEELTRGGRHQVYLHALDAVEPLL